MPVALVVALVALRLPHVPDVAKLTMSPLTGAEELVTDADTWEVFPLPAVRVAGLADTVIAFGPPDPPEEPKVSWAAAVPQSTVFDAAVYSPSTQMSGPQAQPDPLATGAAAAPE